MTINEWTQTRAARLMTKANNEIETVGANAFIEYIAGEGYGLGGAIDDVTADLVTPTRWCLCEECIIRRKTIETRFSLLFVLCLGCGNVPVPISRKSEKCAVCEVIDGHE